MSESRAFLELTAAARAGPPPVGFILGSGMSQVLHDLQPRYRVPFAEVPGLAAPTVAGHGGSLVLGDWAGRRVLVFEGRQHYYEEHSWEAVVRPVHVAQALGVRVLLLTNAAGGIHDALGPGSLAVLRDHIEWTRPYWWRWPGPGGLGPSRPSPYAPRLVALLAEAGRRTGVPLLEGVYAAVTGPCYETPAEVRALRYCGADVVGMSTAREVQAGFDLGLECGAVSLVTNRAAGLAGTPLSHQEVLEQARAQGDRLALLFEEVLRLL